MKQIKKGRPGYIRAQKKKLMIQTLIEFGLVLAIFLTGYLTTKTRLNLLTLVAVLGCLPASRMLVSLIAIFPYHSIEVTKAREIKEKSTLLTTAFDMVVTSREKIMPIDAIAISNDTIFGYAGNKKTDPEIAAKHITNILNENRFTSVKVKIFHDYVAFLSRVEGLNNIMAIEQNNDTQHEQALRRVILNISM